MSLILLAQTNVSGGLVVRLRTEHFTHNNKHGVSDSKQNITIIKNRMHVWCNSMGTGCILIAVPRWTQPLPSVGRIDELWFYRWVIIQMAMGECLAYSSLSAGPNVKVAAWPMSWRPLGANRIHSSDPSELLMALKQWKHNNILDY